MQAYLLYLSLSFVFAVVGDEHTVIDSSVVLPRAVKADYQESQTAWKLRMENEETKWKSKRDDIKKAKLEAYSLNHAAACSICSNVKGLTRVRCHTCRQYLCADCDKSIHFTQVTHQRKCEFDGCLHALLPTEFVTVDGLLEYLSNSVLDV
jgi:hypothetical protein